MDRSILPAQAAPGTERPAPLPSDVMSHLRGEVIHRGVAAGAAVGFVAGLLGGAVALLATLAALAGPLLVCGGSLVLGLVGGAFLGWITALMLLLVLSRSRSLHRVVSGQTSPLRLAITASAAAHAPYLLLLVATHQPPSPYMRADYFFSFFFWPGVLLVSWIVFVGVGRAALGSVGPHVPQRADYPPGLK